MLPGISMGSLAHSSSSGRGPAALGVHLCLTDRSGGGADRPRLGRAGRPIFRQCAGSGSAPWVGLKAWRRSIPMCGFGYHVLISYRNVSGRLASVVVFRLRRRLFRRTKPALASVWLTQPSHSMALICARTQWRWRKLAAIAVPHGPAKAMTAAVCPRSRGGKACFGTMASVGGLS